MSNKPGEQGRKVCSELISQQLLIILIIPRTADTSQRETTGPPASELPGVIVQTLPPEPLQPKDQDFWRRGYESAALTGSPGDAHAVLSKTR